MEAIKNDDKKSFKSLLELGANINGRGIDGETPYFFAVRTKSKQFCDRLIKAGANVDMRRDDGETPATYAVANVNNFLSYVGVCNFTLVNNDGDTPLIIACRNNDFQDTSSIIDRHDININARNNKGETALYWAAFNHCEQVDRNMGDVIEMLFAFEAKFDNRILCRKEIDIKTRMRLAGPSKYGPNEIVDNYETIIDNLTSKNNVDDIDPCIQQHVDIEISDFMVRLEYTCYTGEININVLKSNESLKNKINKLDICFFESDDESDDES
jgi:ankyrin repeat protein